MERCPRKLSCAGTAFKGRRCRRRAGCRSLIVRPMTDPAAPARPTRPTLGLCCLFTDASPRFRQATATYVQRLDPETQGQYLADVAGANAIALLHAVQRCAELGIGAFRITSGLVPLATHPVVGRRLEDLPNGAAIRRALAAAGEVARLHGIRLSFHPDQFVVLGSARPEVVASSVVEMDHHGAMAKLVGADTICLHGGGQAGGAEAAGARLLDGIERLGEDARSRLALENDDRVWTPAALLPLCDRAGVPFIYDVHHHRCLGDGVSVEDVTAAAVETWRRARRTPYFHISSPRDGWGARDPRPHADFIDPADLPAGWRGIDATIDVEAKAKEQAVVALQRALTARDG